MYKPHPCGHWRAPLIVVDATNPDLWSARFAGIGAGLASFLQASLELAQCALLPVLFSSVTKADLGWNFVGTVATGRFQEYFLSEAEPGEPDIRQFWHEVKTCKYGILPGPGERIRWGVWDPPASDGLIALGHDDLLVSAALCTVLD